MQTMTSDEYKRRRRKVIETIGPDAVLILVAAPEYLRNGDAHYFYRQNSDFYYLTGFKEPEAVLVLIPQRAEGEFILFNRKRNPAAEIWTGIRAGQQGAVEIYDADEAFPIDAIDTRLPELLVGKQRIYYPIGLEAAFDAKLISWVNKVAQRIRAGINAPHELINSNDVLHEMRLRKSNNEIAMMRKAGEVSAYAHRCAMEQCRPGMKEYELAAIVIGEFARHDCFPPAYSTIVGGGVNSCVLHYIDNNARLNDGELVLIDAGGEYQYYASDITRTFPINGKYTNEQRAIYNLVLQAQLTAIKSIKPNVPWQKLQEIAARIISEGLLELGLLKGSLEEILTKHTYRQFYMHNVGHWLGLDVHDAGSYAINGRSRPLEPNFLFTVEPGIYVQPAENVDKKWWNIGVRIEDDVLVTQTGCEVLTKDVPKEISEIEALMQKRYSSVTRK
jgi:Xaa-Pro aminopeptidase